MVTDRQLADTICEVMRSEGITIENLETNEVPDFWRKVAERLPHKSLDDSDPSLIINIDPNDLTAITSSLFEEASDSDKSTETSCACQDVTQDIRELTLLRTSSSLRVGDTEELRLRLDPALFERLRNDSRKCDNSIPKLVTAILWNYYGRPMPSPMTED